MFATQIQRTAIAAAMAAPIALAAAGAAFAADAVERSKAVWQDAIPENGEIFFKVKREGSPMGTHRLVFDRQGDSVTVDIDIDLSVDVAFLNFYSYDHDNTEVWRDGELVSVTTETDNNGKDEFAKVAREGAAYTIKGSKNEGTVEGPLLPTSYWNPATIETGRMVSTQDGRVFEFDVTRVGTEKVATADGEITATKYELRGDLDLDLWYAGSRWVKCAFTVDGNDIEYVMARGMPGTQTALADQAQ